MRGRGGGQRQGENRSPHKDDTKGTHRQKTEGKDLKQIFKKSTIDPPLHRSHVRKVEFAHTWGRIGGPWIG